MSTAITTDILKMVVSRPRPQFYFICNYAGYADAVNSGNYTDYFNNVMVGNIGSYDKCLNQNAIDEATVSWPSGHSSMSFAGMTVIVMIVRTMFNIKNVFSVVGMITFGPYIVSSWIATSRVLDNKHHEDDIMAGAVIGVVCTLISFHTLNIVLLKCDMMLLPTNHDVYYCIEAGNTNSNSRDGKMFSTYYKQYSTYMSGISEEIVTRNDKV
jgi:membrane-associated phospholipid phosphatase